MSVSIHNLYFKYPDSVDYSLQDFNLDIKSNEKITLTGSNGSGKATLLKLMTAFFEPQRGNIIYDNIPIKNYDVTQLRSYIAECISEDRIFEGTLLENLTVGRDISQYKISEVLDNIGLTSFIHQLPQGYNTEIGPQGKRLPGSVTQKIILARNLLKEPRLMIVEDIFKNIEKKEKLLIFKYILQKNAERTVIVVSKDPDIMQLTDRIITLDDGKVVDTQIVNKK